MIYRGGFYSINDTDFTVEIETKGGSGVKEITLGESPFVVSQDSSDEIMFSPVRGSGATIQIVVEEAIFDLYSEHPLDTKVRLIETKTGKIVWCGYLTPCMYSQDYFNELETLEIEAVDTLGVLQNVKWSDKHTGNEKTFAELIDMCLAKSGVKNWYISDNIEISGLTSTKNISELLRIYDSNFFEEKDSEALTDLDKAWTAYDMIYEIAQYLGYVAVASGSDVYFLDYDAIRNGRNTYHSFSVGNPNSTGKVTKEYSFGITGDKMAPGTPQLSLDAVYDSVSVKDEFYKVDLKNNSGKKTNITYPDNERMFGWYGQGNNPGKYNTKYQDGFEESLNGENSTFQCICQDVWKDRRIATLWQFWKDPRITVYNYTNDANRRLVTTLRDRCAFGDMMEYNGAYVTKFYKGNNISGLDGYNSGYPIETKLNHWNKVFGTQCKKIPLEDMIVMVNKKNEAGHIGPGHRIRTGKYDRIYPANLGTDPEDAMSYPYLEFRDNSSFYFTGQDSYLLIKGQVLVHDEDYTPYPMSDGADNSKLKRDVDKKIKCEFYLHAKLQIGNRFWDGSDWVEKESFFRLFWQDECGKTSSRDTRQNQSFYDKWYSFQNITRIQWDYTEEAYWVSAPPADVIGGQLCLTLYANKDMWGQSNHNKWGEKNKWSDNRYNRYYSSVICIKNFGLDTYVNNGKIDNQEGDTDTIYSNVIDSQGINPLDEITFKICTYDNKSTSYSTVSYDDNGTKTMLQHVKNNVLNSEILKDTESSSGNYNLTPEEMYIYRIVRQYEKPRVVYEKNLTGYSHMIYGLYTDGVIKDKKFIAAQIDVDYKLENTNIKLIEKV